MLWDGSPNRNTAVEEIESRQRQRAQQQFHLLSSPNRPYSGHRRISTDRGVGSAKLPGNGIPGNGIPGNGIPGNGYQSQLSSPISGRNPLSSPHRLNQRKQEMKDSRDVKREQILWLRREKISHDQYQKLRVAELELEGQKNWQGVIIDDLVQDEFSQDQDQEFEEYLREMEDWDDEQLCMLLYSSFIGQSPQIDENSGNFMN